MYHDLGQLIREDNTAKAKTYVYTYDDAGNLLTKLVYSLTAAGLTPAAADLENLYTYGYTDEAWGDKLTWYNGVELTYDEVGNSLTYYNGSSYSFTWENGRQLESATKGSSTTTYTYNADGIRTSKTTGSTTRTYLLNGTQIIGESWGTNLLVYIYDSDGSPIGMAYRNTSYPEGAFDTYWFEKNLQGDIVAVYDQYGIKQIAYTYDAWGNSSVSYYNSSASTTATYNPFRYRGYYYDTETGFYYLQTRYYDPSIGRFINADSFISTGQGLLGFNMFAYCSNNPVTRTDETGAGYETIFDIISLVFSIGDVASNPSDRWAWIGLVGDIVDLIPVVSGVGEVTKALGAAKKAGEILDDVHDARKAIENMAEMAEAGQDGYRTFKTAKKNMEFATNIEWHHLVEQSQAVRSGFSKTSINNSSNLVGISSDLHHRISAFYSSKPKFLKNNEQYKTVREWVSTLNYQQQYTFGVLALQRAKYM